MLGILLATSSTHAVGALGAWILFLLTTAVGAFLLAGPELAIVYHWAAPLVRRATGRPPSAEPVPGAEPEEGSDDAPLPGAEPDEGLVLLDQDEVADEEEAPAEDELPEEAAAEAENPAESPEESPEEIAAEAPQEADQEPQPEPELTARRLDSGR